MSTQALLWVNFSAVCTSGAWPSKWHVSQTCWGVSTVQHVSSQWSQLRHRGQWLSPYSVHSLVLKLFILGFLFFCWRLSSYNYLLATGQMTSSTKVQVWIFLIIHLHVEWVSLRHICDILLIANLERVLCCVNIQRSSSASSAFIPKINAISSTCY